MQAPRPRAYAVADGQDARATMWAWWQVMGKKKAGRGYRPELLIAEGDARMTSELSQMVGLLSIGHVSGRHNRRRIDRSAGALKAMSIPIT